jgi:tRNA(fMet)-specific endonuclease VapC
LIVLDTDVLIEIVDKESKRGSDATQKALESGEPIATTAFSLHELLFGLRRQGKSIPDTAYLWVLPFRQEDALLSSKIEAYLEGKGEPVERADTIIAAVTIGNGGTLFTYNRSHFQRMSPHGLRLFLDP